MNLYLQKNVHTLNRLYTSSNHAQTSYISFSPAFLEYKNLLLGEEVVVVVVLVVILNRKLNFNINFFVVL